MSLSLTDVWSWNRLTHLAALFSGQGSLLAMADEETLASLDESTTRISLALSDERSRRDYAHLPIGGKE